MRAGQKRLKCIEKIGIWNEHGPRAEKQARAISIYHQGIAKGRSRASSRIDVNDINLYSGRLMTLGTLERMEHATETAKYMAN